MPSLSFLRHPLGFGKAKEEREATLRSLTEELEEKGAQLEEALADLEKCRAELENFRTSTDQIRNSQAKLEEALRQDRAQSAQKTKEQEDSLKTITEALKIEQASSIGVRNELIVKNRILSQIQSIWDRELYGHETESQPAEHANAPSDQAKTESGPMSLAYVSVILDGDTHGYQFSDAISKQWARGGELAAQLLLNDIRRYVQTQSGIPANYEIKVQIILNLQDTIRHRGPHYGGCLQGFLKCNAMFDVIDSGTGKESADHKIRAKLRLDIYNRDCRLVIFGGCHDGGYIPVLREYVMDSTARSKLRLLLPINLHLSYRYFDLKWAEFVSVFPRPTQRYIDENGKLLAHGETPGQVLSEESGEPGQSQAAEELKSRITDVAGQTASLKDNQPASATKGKKKSPARYAK